MAYSWSKTVAMYSASLLRLGNFVDAGFVAAILFERYIEDEMIANGIEATSNGDFLFNAIERLSRKDPVRFKNISFISSAKSATVISSTPMMPLKGTKTPRSGTGSIKRLQNWLILSGSGLIPMAMANSGLFQAYRF